MAFTTRVSSVGVSAQPLRDAYKLEDAFTTVADNASPWVVNIRVEVARSTQTPNGWPFGFFGGQDDSGAIQIGGGSGFVISSDGHVLTNNHVVKDASRIEVGLKNGKRFRAKVVGTDPATDLAVLKIDAKGLPTATFADSDKAKVGQWVVAIGSPFGLDYTVTTGVLSAKGRGGFGANEIEDYLQTDASINPGNSGGPLVDLRGRVLGINTMIIGRGTGIGFAIPSALAQRVANQIISKGTVRRPWLGVSFQEFSPELARHFGKDVDGGALVNKVYANGPAQKANLRAGDLVTAVDGVRILEGRDLLRAILRKDVGESVKLTFLRDGKSQTSTIKLGERPSDNPTAAAPNRSNDSGTFGLKLEQLTPELRQRMNYSGEGRLLVVGVTPGSEAQRAGLRPGDLILKADQRPVHSVDQMRAALRDGSALLLIEREGNQFFTAIEKSSD
ncbi:MAG: Do family serine endopeptidase [Polyangiales bacterium]